MAVPTLREIEAALTQALLGGDESPAAAAVLGDGLEPGARLQLYRHHVFTTLTATLQGTYPVVCRNLGIPCDLERSIFARQFLARHQADEIQSCIEVIPLKGLHLAHRVYPSPGLRDMGDLDLLVRRSRLREADAALKQLGYLPDHDPENVDGGSLSAVEYWRDESMPVHLHWHVSNASLPHFMYRVDVDEL